MYSTASNIQNENVQDSQMTLRVTIKFKQGAGANALTRCASQKRGLPHLQEQFSTSRSYADDGKRRQSFRAR